MTSTEGISYELAAKLKKHGFPQKGNGYTRPYTKPIQVKTAEPNDYVPEQTLSIEPIYFPTLPELIAECGEDLFDLRRDGEGWAAISNLTFDGRFDTDISLYENGATPSIAVANLYIALHPLSGEESN